MLVAANGFVSLGCHNEFFSHIVDVQLAGGI